MVSPDCPCRKGLTQRPASATMVAPASPGTGSVMQQHSVGEWALAGGVVVSGAIVGAVIGAKLAHPWVGLVLGIGGGLAFNWFTGCKVCRATAGAA